MKADYLITLTASPAIEEVLIDWLLKSETHAGFTSFKVNGHSSSEEGLSLSEQVAGMKKQIRFQINLPEAALAAFIAQLQTDFKGVGIHYWVSPVIESGRI